MKTSRDDLLRDALAKDGIQVADISHLRRAVESLLAINRAEVITEVVRALETHEERQGNQYPPAARFVRDLL